MIRIKNYIFPEENILYIRQLNEDFINVLRKRPNEYDHFKDELEIKATFEDIEWNYGTPQETQRQMQKELCKSCYYRDTISNKLEELEEENKKLKFAMQDTYDSANDICGELQQRINKAIEYINDNVAVYGFGNKALPHWEFDDDNIQDLEKILKGE